MFHIKNFGGEKNQKVCRASRGKAELRSESGSLKTKRMADMKSQSHKKTCEHK